MSCLWSKRPPGVIADLMVFSDVHFSHNVPSARGETQEEWYESLLNFLKEIWQIYRDTSCPHIAIAGDLFHSWKEPVELVNFLLRNLNFANLYAIPGQHDLPYHQIQQVHKSPFRTLEETHKITYMPRNMSFELPDRNFKLVGFEWGAKIIPVDQCAYWQNNNRKNIAIVHSYIWKDHKHPGATAQQEAKYWAQKLLEAGYNLAFFGDNHTPFDFKYKCRKTGDEICIINCGAAIRRTVDELKNHKPRVLLLGNNGRVYSHYLETKRDKIADPGNKKKTPLSANSLKLIEKLKQMGQVQWDFVAQLKIALQNDGLSERLKKYVIEVIEEEGNVN